MTWAFLNIRLKPGDWVLTSSQRPNNEVLKPLESTAKSSSSSFNGIPDFSIRYLRIGAYFAVEKEHTGNSAIYILEYKYYVDTETNKDPFKYKEFNKFIPPHANPRITAQSGVFTIHPEPDKPFEGEDDAVLKKIIIINKNNLRKKIKDMLYYYGIHEASLFPGLESTAHYIEWMKTYSY